MILGVVLTSLFLFRFCNGEECATNPDKPLYPRTFLGTFNGQLKCCFNEETMRKAYGECGNGLGALAQEMFQFFESGYGLDLSAVKDKPFEAFVNSDYSFTPFSTKEEGPVDMIKIETFYEYANYLHTPMVIAAWTITANNSFTGPRGTMEPGQRNAFGMMRIILDGDDICMTAHHRKAVGKAPPSGLIPLDLVVYNEQWGFGSARGTSFDTGGISDQKYLITFPAELENLH